MTTILHHWTIPWSKQVRHVRNGEAFVYGTLLYSVKYTSTDVVLPE